MIAMMARVSSGPGLESKPKSPAEVRDNVLLSASGIRLEALAR
jgi:hypothetical protein